MPLLGQRDPRYRVHYSDGVKSERMDRGTAMTYADLFDGVVVCVEPRFMDHVRKWMTAMKGRRG